MSRIVRGICAALVAASFIALVPGDPAAAPPGLAPAQRAVTPAPPPGIGADIRRFRVPVELMLELFEVPGRIELGNPGGDVIIVSLYDYNCPFCRKVHGELLDFVRGDGDIRLILVPWPVLSPASEEAARVGVALRRQVNEDAYLRFHSAMMTGRGLADGRRALDVGRTLVPDPARLVRDVSDPGVHAEVKAMVSLGDRLGLGGTPAYVIANEAFVGDLPVVSLARIAAALRDCDMIECP